MRIVEHLTKEQLDAYAADSLAPGETEDAERHLLECAACRDQMPAPTPEQFWSALLADDEPEREEIYASERLSPAASSPFSTVFSFFRQPAFLGACVLILMAGFSFLVWRALPEKSNPAQETAQTIETSPAENNLPPDKKPPVVVGDEAQKSESAKTPQTLQPRTDRAESADKNAPTALEIPIQPKEAENRELALLLENTPPAVSSLRPDGQTVLRNGNRDERKTDSAASAFALLAPVGETVIEDAPVFRWQKAADASSYRISILDADFNQVVTADVSDNSFKPNVPLKRGAKYFWRVEATTASGKVVAPQPPKPPAVFRVAENDTEIKIASLKKKRADRLPLAVFYAQEGMLDSAACELRQILAQNPKRTAARRLLARVERWKKENNASGVQRCGPSMATKADQ